jgi:hypothetical protein
MGGSKATVDHPAQARHAAGGAADYLSTDCFTLEISGGRRPNDRPRQARSSASTAARLGRR